MANKMLIDATHPEETRVVVLRGNRVEEFDFEAANRKQLRGNIYLAKVTRVEPSLQAAFVDYGGNRHGFLAFSEIHPDYYQIPVADRQALLEEERLRHSSEYDFEPADDEADFQEIEEVDDDDLDDNGDQPEEDAKPRKSRSSRGRTSRGRGGREKGRTASADDAAGDANGAGTGEDAPELVDNTATSAADISLETSSDPVSSDEPAASGDSVSEASAASDESETAPGEDEKPAKPIPDRFLAASDDDDAVISGELPLVGAKKPDDTEVTGDEIEVSREIAEITQDAESEAASDATLPDADKSMSKDGSVTAQTADTDTEAAEKPADDIATDDAAAADGSGDETESRDETDADGLQSADAAPEAVQEAEEEDDQAAPTKSRRNQRSTESAPSRPRRRYKIQEVIKRRQIILVQVVKEERGTKGAALTTYLSLAGRYSVLMPNSARGGGISRKITNPGDRKRLKTIANELPVPEGMGVILRTAGASRTKTEVKRDFEYLMRLWENVRDLTLQSSAPALVYEEGNLVKRSIRDLYNKDIDEVQVAGDIGYREAKDFMRMLMPSHAKNVQPYKDQVPIFAKNRVEPQLDAMFLPRVTLPSGGYIIINQTEALVAVDVNSGKATREHNIEDTALRTNVEASEEIARQLRLRDLAGLIVIDFIDMEEKRNNRTVERKLKDCLKSDRARIQVGRISHFGLLEMSRQRLRTGVLESSTELCPHCHGTGVIRSTESVALYVLRSIEDQLLRSASHNLNVRIRTEVALYIINNKRYSLTDMENRYGVQLNLAADETIEEAYCIIERDGVAESRRVPLSQGPDIVQPDTIDPDEVPDESGEPAANEVDQQDEGDGAPKKRRRKRRRRVKDSDANDRAEQSNDDQTASDAQKSESKSDSDANSEADPDSANASDEAGAKKRRRGRRGGRRNKRTDNETSAQNGDEQGEAAGDNEAGTETSDTETAPESGDAAPAIAASAEETGGDEGSVPQIPAVETKSVEEAAESESGSSDVEEPVAEEPVREDPAAEIVSMEPPAPEIPDEDDRPKKSGWWQKRSFFKT